MTYESECVITGALLSDFFIGRGRERNERRKNASFELRLSS